MMCKRSISYLCKALEGHARDLVRVADELRPEYDAADILAAAEKPEKVAGKIKAELSISLDADFFPG